MAKKKTLGRGLGALLADTDISTTNKSPELNKITKEDISKKVLDLNLSDISPNANQPRTIFNDDKLLELSQSLSSIGIIEPIIVKDLQNGKFEIIAGERRWRAAKLADFKTIPAVVKDDTSNIFEIMLVENIQREDLTPIEEAKSYDILIKNKNLTQDELAKKVGKSRSHITNILRTLKLPKKIQEHINNKQISLGHAKVLVGLNNKKQEEIVQKIIKEGISVRQTENLSKEKDVPRETITSNNKKTSIKKDENILNLEEKLRDFFKTKVNIKNSENNSGKIEIEYYNLDDLETVLNILKINIDS